MKALVLPAHWTQAIPIPDGVPDEVAVLADPFAVSLHSITRNPPPAGGKALVWGGGALGTAAIAILRALHPDVEVAAVVRHPAQQALARRLGRSSSTPSRSTKPSWSRSPSGSADGSTGRESGCRSRAPVASMLRTTRSARRRRSSSRCGCSRRGGRSR